MSGENYLIPIDAVLNSEKDVNYETLPLGKIQNAMEEAGTERNGTFTSYILKHITTPNLSIEGLFKKVRQVDLAIVRFSSDRNYTVAKLGNSDNIKEGEIIYRANYYDLNNYHELKSVRTDYYFDASSLTGRLSNPNDFTNKGYELIGDRIDEGYDLIYRETHSAVGVAVLNSQGLLIAVGGEPFFDGNTRESFGFGIPIEYYINNKNRFTVTLNP